MARRSRILPRYRVRADGRWEHLTHDGWVPSSPFAPGLSSAGRAPEARSAPQARRSTTIEVVRCVSEMPGAFLLDLPPIAGGDQ